LTNAVWSSAESAETLSRLRERLASYSSVVNCLVSKEGTLVPFEISIPIWDNLPDPTDRSLVATLRYVRLNDGQGETPEDLDLTRPDPAKPIIAQFSGDREILLSFRRERGNGIPVQERLTPWWILRQVRDGRAVPAREPNKWQVRVPVKDTTARPNLSGNAYFDVHLASPTPFPKKDEWPK
jgi:hypothetical protein